MSVVRVQEDQGNAQLSILGLHMPEATSVISHLTNMQ